MWSRIQLLVLDAHGVVLNAYWPRFLREVAGLTGETEADVVRRWNNCVRADAWLGHISDNELWQRLIPPQHVSHDWRAILEAGYALGPAAPHLRRWTECVPIWLLSNHRTHWLRPRLERFNLLVRFPRVLVSDRIGAVKPGREMFDFVLQQSPNPNHVLFVDDQTCNVEAARRQGISALHADPARDWITAVYNSLGVLPDGIRSSS